MPPTLLYQNTIPLQYQDDCGLLGIRPDMTLYVEETYTEEHWFAHYALTLEGILIERIDEYYGKRPDARPMKLPDDAIPNRVGGRVATDLNYMGARHRGMRDLERIAESVRPLTMPTKMKLVEKLGLDVMPPMIFGIAESYVLSEAVLIPDELYLVCRRLRIAYALNETKIDQEQQPYDYDTVVMYIAHLYNPKLQDNEVSTDEAFAGLPGKMMNRPMDCLIYNRILIIADGGDENTKSCLHLWKVMESD